MAFSEAIRLVTIGLDQITGGLRGLFVPILFQNDFLYFQFTDKIYYYYIIFSFVIAAILLVRYIEKGKIGFYLSAIRENQDAAETLGVNIVKYKYIAMILSCSLAAIGGTFYAQYFHYIQPDSIMTTSITFNLILFTVVGGIGTIQGPVIGALLLYPLTEVLRYALRGFIGIDLVLYALLMITVIMIAPSGASSVLKKPYAKILEKLPKRRHENAHT
jgi:branched-chain amino acid transport system permease protein